MKDTCDKCGGTVDRPHTISKPDLYGWMTLVCDNRAFHGHTCVSCGGRKDDPRKPILSKDSVCRNPFHREEATDA
jgi:hypothetical protein